MRSILAFSLIASIGPGCASQARIEAAAGIETCPNRVAATITNPARVEFDVKYADPSGSERTIGQISGSSTRTFDLPGDGRGRVTVAQDAASRDQPVQQSLQPRIRVHCATRG